MSWLRHTECAYYTLEQLMTDEPRPDEPGMDAGATATEPSTPESEEKQKLHQTVEMRDVGPCKKHIKVSVDRADIDARMDEKYSELVPDANVPGFRPGKAPRKVVVHRFHKEVADQVRTEILLASLEQLADEHDVAPLSAPNIDPYKIDLPKEGPLVYEFEVEVRPQFDLPNYRGLKIKKPVHAFTDAELAQEERRILSRYGQLEPKANSIVELGDILVADGVTRDGDRVLGNFTGITVSVEKQLAFKDGVAENFGEQVVGAKLGQSRTVDITMSNSVADYALRGQVLKSAWEIKEIKTLKLPELTHEFLHAFGVHTEEQFHELIRVVLQRRLEYHQHQAARQQIMQHLAATANWDLPEDLLQRQARRAISRRIMEMRSDGISEDEIRGRLRIMQQDILQSTAQGLKEHFVLQKIAELEKIEIDDDDIEDEIERMARQEGESPRRVRARLEKEDMMEALAAEIIERRALDVILDSAEYEEIPLDQEGKAPVATVEEQAVPGEMPDPLAAPPEEPAATPPASE
jgi:trigger factor